MAVVAGGTKIIEGKKIGVRGTIGAHIYELRK
jgi:hypothetical protein